MHSFSTRQSMVLKDQNTIDHIAWTIGNGDPVHEVCIPYMRYSAHGNSKGEARARNRHNLEKCKRVVRNLEERNVGTKGKSFKQGLISAKDLTMELPEGSELPYHILDQLT